MNYNKLKKLLKKTGCRLEREGKRHEIWINPKTCETFPVGRHGEEEVATDTTKVNSTCGRA